MAAAARPSRGIVAPLSMCEPPAAPGAEEVLLSPPLPSPSPSVMVPADAIPPSACLIRRGQTQGNLIIDEASGDFFGVDAEGNKVKLTLEAQEKKYLDACNVPVPPPHMHAPRTYS